MDDRAQDLDDWALASAAPPPQLPEDAATASERLKHMKELYASKKFAHFPLEVDMTKVRTTLTRRRIFRAGAGLAVATTATPLLIPASVRAEDDRQAGTERLTGNGFYRFKI